MEGMIHLSTRLSLRLKTLVACVPTGARLVDVGTDHAYIPIYLAEMGWACKLIATDVVLGPLETARANVSERGLENQISIRYGNGLEPIEPGEVDTILIAGMGGSTAVEILKTSPEVVSRTSTVIIQPMNASYRVRRFFDTHQFKLVKELVLEEEGRLYEVIVAQKVQESESMAAGDPAYHSYRRNGNELDFAYEFGPLLLSNPTPFFVIFLKQELCQWSYLLPKVSRSTSVKARKRQEELSTKIKIAHRWLQNMEERLAD